MNQKSQMLLINRTGGSIINMIYLVVQNKQKKVNKLWFVRIVVMFLDNRLDFFCTVVPEEKKLFYTLKPRLFFFLKRHIYGKVLQQDGPAS
jgi:hypothetical protein